jgi:hypothetical protein
LQENVFIIKKGLFATFSKASIIKVTVNMRLDLLPHEEILVVLSRPRWCGGNFYVVVKEW